MEPQAGMLAGLFERSMGLGPDWRIEDVWFEQPEGAQAELHVRVGRVPGRAVECPSCHARCGVYDTRERTWRHLDIWQYRTVVHCAVPRADCPSCGPRTVRMPWETRPNSHFTALFEAQVLVMKLSGMTTSAVAGAVRESDGRVWRLLSSAVPEARAAADHSGVTRVGVDETACKRGQSYVTTLVDLDARRVVAVTSGRDKASPARLCDELEAHGGDRRRIVEATRDMSLAYSFGIAAAMPNARQTVDRFHVMQLLAVATDRVRCRERGESAEKRALLRGTKYVWLRREGTLSDRQLGVRRDPAREHLMTARACAMTEAMEAVNWKAYGLQQPKGGVPLGPVVFFLHIASVWVPFTSESKEAIAHYPEILRELTFALQEAGRQLSVFLSKRRRQAEADRKRSYIEKYIPHLALGLKDILALSDKQKAKVEDDLTRMLERTHLDA